MLLYFLRTKTCRRQYIPETAGGMAQMAKILYLELIGEGDKRSGESSVAKGGYHDDFESEK